MERYDDVYQKVSDRYELPELFKLSELYVLDKKDLQKSLLIAKIVQSCLECQDMTILSLAMTEKDNDKRRVMFQEHCDISSAKCYISSYLNIALNEFFRSVGMEII